MTEPTTKQDTTETGTSAAASSALFAEALACVAWDGTVDTDKLLAIEFAHDKAIVRRVIDVAASYMGAPGRAMSFLDTGDNMTIGGSGIDDGWESRPFVVSRIGDKWHIDTPAQVSGIFLSDTQLALYCALCARHKHFSMTWAVSLADMDRAGYRHATPMEAGWCTQWRMMWMSRVIDALAAESGAWTGDGIMRTQNLARTLLDILRARNAEGPLAGLKSKSQTSSGTAVPPDLQEAVKVAHDMPRGIEFATDGDPLPHSMNYDADHAVALLRFIVNATQRVYETQSLYTQVILPAEYDALQRNTPGGTFQ
ncbi:hypothetical protein pmac_cds_410 [Pandoravirus macleodensis]|uniref:Uncharacterized protein n=1 Tax=Pandoravirus macleodensis TaxID=2107707 RepID=A0A2U7UF51_9VIRU|nr:hypothetical protein pmac_cds_410 [Pandoravirus macleodensis]AVK77098.1 hypothetical protein pmac_cds_410 [Pandoravirus macleodensis]